MTDKEKLVELIDHVCEGHVENLMQPGGVEAVADYLTAHGVTVREPQKPLTVEELYDRQGEIVYLEYAKNKLEEYPFVLALLGCHFALFDSYVGQNAGLKIADNGHTWRCWAEKPTEEEREAAEWCD